MSVAAPDLRQRCGASRSQCRLQIKTCISTFIYPAIPYSAAAAAYPPFAHDNTHLHRPCAKHAHPCCRCFSLLDRTLSAVLALAASPWVHRGAGLNRLRTNFWQGECLPLRAESCRCPSPSSPLLLASKREECTGKQALRAATEQRRLGLASMPDPACCMLHQLCPLAGMLQRCAEEPASAEVS